MVSRCPEGGTKTRPGCLPRLTHKGEVKFDRFPEFKAYRNTDLMASERICIYERSLVKRDPRGFCDQKVPRILRLGEIACRTVLCRWNASSTGLNRSDSIDFMPRNHRTHLGMTSNIRSGCSKGSAVGEAWSQTCQGKGNQGDGPDSGRSTWPPRQGLNPKFHQADLELTCL